MIRYLRKRHLQSWIALACITPVIMITAWTSRHEWPVADDWKKKQSVLKPELLASGVLLGNRVELRGTSVETADQFVWHNDEPLGFPSAVIYLQNRDTFSITNAQYIGRIESRGDYLFEVPAGQNKYHIVVYDFIHEVVVGHVKFAL